LKAWRVYGPKDMRLDDIPYPVVRPGWVVIKVRMVQLSITEVEQFYSDVFANQEWSKRFKEEGPLQLFGHEFCGEVVELGKGVQTLELGDRVFWGLKLPCYKCDTCKAGYESYCHNLQLVGNNVLGCLAEYALLPAACLTRVKNCTDSEITAMQPLTGALGTIIAADIAIGDTIAIFGMGVMGLLNAQFCRAAGASTIIGVDIRDDSLELGRQLGVDILINAGKTDPVKEIIKATGTLGADIVFECASGNPKLDLSGTKTISQAIESTRAKGKMVLVSIPQPGAVIETGPLTWRGIDYRGMETFTKEQLNWAVRLVETKRVQLAPLVTHILEGIEKIPEAFEKTINKRKYGAIGPAQVIIASNS
jgi:threonine dehydrogenase-like Zn-dependent dehydrogenase